MIHETTSELVRVRLQLQLRCRTGYRANSAPQFTAHFHPHWQLRNVAPLNYLNDKLRVGQGRQVSVSVTADLVLITSLRFYST